MGDNTPPSSSTFDPIQVLKQLRGGDGGINVNGGSVVSGVNVSIHRGEVKGGGGMTEGGIAGGTGGRKLNGSAEGVRVNARYDTPQHIYKDEYMASSSGNGRLADTSQVVHKGNDTLNNSNRGNTSYSTTPPTHPNSEPSKWNTNGSSDSGMITLLQRQVAEKASENIIYKLLKALEEAHRTIGLLREENKALEHALALHSQAPLPPSFPLPSHPSELTLLRDRVAYLESALESALESTSGELGPDWNLGELELDSPPSSSPAPPSPASYPPYPTTDYPISSSHSHPTNSMPPPKTATLQHSKNGNFSTTGKELDKRPPFISAISPHSSRFVKPGDTAKLQIPKAPPDVGKPVIRIDLSSEMSKTQQPKATKKRSGYTRTIPVSITNYPNM